MIQKLLLAIIFSLFASQNFSQEVISDLWLNPNLVQTQTKNSLPSYKSYNHSFYFLIDTLSLPFIDDFSTDRSKSYFADLSNSVGDTIYYSYSVDGAFDVDSLPYMLDTTYTYFYNSATDTIDSTLNASIQVIFYNNEIDPFFPNDTITVWPIYWTYTVDTLGNITDSVLISPDSTIYLGVDTLTMITDDNSLWLDSYVFINTDFPLNPVTVGVATLDGLNDHGQPYNFDDPYSYGVADYFTSKPIDLNYQVLDSVYLSFFYEPQGYGNYPEEEDSLVLEFFSPVDREWHHVWAIEGSDSVVFQQVMIPISDSAYLHNGFQFRFKNYATLSGALDHWHIDYIRLDSARTLFDTAFTDVAFVEKAPSMLTTYEAMPWKHFLVDSSMKDTTYVLAANYTTVIKNTNYSFQIFEDASILFNYPGYSNNFDPHTTFNFFGVVDTFVFYSGNEDSASFEIRHVLKTDNNDLIKQNDTVRHEQKFYNYYAYDDGTAEVAYGLNTQYAQLAYQFTNKLEDTLRGVQMYFAPVIFDVSEKEFMLTIWGDNNGAPGTILYQQKEEYTPIYNEFRNSFYAYLLDTILVLKPGTFYVGWEQLSEDMLNIGFDRNNDEHKKMFYNVVGSWNQSVQAGALMMRPLFGDTVTVTSVKEVAQPEWDYTFTIYPNPSTDFIHISPLSKIDYSVQLYDVSGKLLDKYTNSPHYISTSSLQQGMYFLQFVDKYSQKIYSEKLIITR